MKQPCLLLFAAAAGLVMTVSTTNAQEGPQKMHCYEKDTILSHHSCKKTAVRENETEFISEPRSDTVTDEKKVKVIIIENNDDLNAATNGKVVEKNIIVTKENNKAEKAIITETPEKTEKKKKKLK